MTPEQFEEFTLRPLESFARDCHAASVALVRSGVHGICRVARGACPGVGGQHSWVVLGMNVYDKNAVVIDPTLWSYTGGEPEVWIGKASVKPHLPHGHGSIWEWGRPDEAEGEVVELPEPEGGWSPAARSFLDLLGPLDLEGWIVMAHAPMEGWPSGEIVKQMHEVKRIAERIPIDILGMVTDLNPAGLYLPEEEFA